VGGTRLNNANVVTGFNGSNSKSGNIEFTHDGKSLSITGIDQKGGGDAIIVTSGDLTWERCDRRLCPRSRRRLLGKDLYVTQVTL